MWSGDSLTVLLFLLGGMIAFSIGALTAPTGWRTNVLWAGAVVFLLFALAWLLAPAASPIIAPISPLVVAAVQSNALAMVLIVGVVALMIGGRSPPAVAEDTSPQSGQSLPRFAIDATSRWKPDIGLQQAVGYLGAKSVWREPFSGVGNTVEGTTAALVSALASNKVTAWGSEHPDVSDMFQIAPGFWIEAEVTLDTNFAFSRNRNIGAHNVHLCRREMEQVWPPNQDD